MNKTSIEWTDFTWNPVTGCHKVSAGCKNCYAETLTNRFAKVWGVKSFRDVVEHHDRLGEPEANKKKWAGKKVFVCSMADLFQEEVSSLFIRQVLRRIALHPGTTFQVLTKWPQRALIEIQRLFDSGLITEPIPNLWIGTSVEDQQRADERIPYLLQIPAAVRFLSCEPLLGPISILKSTRIYISQKYNENEKFADNISVIKGNDRQYIGPDWVIVGGESGRGARPMHPDWVRSLQAQCTEKKVSFFFKQWGEYQQINIDFNESEPIKKNNTVVGIWSWWREKTTGRKFQILDHDGDYLGYTDKQSRLHSSHVPIQKVGKSKSGNLLDGVQHLNFPK